MKIVLVGGGSGGSVSPLLSVAESIKEKKPGAIFLFIGTRNGPERKMAEDAGIKFMSIAAGKLRRYFSFRNFLSPFLIAIGFFQAFNVLKEFKPRCVFGTGSFVQVPVMWAAWFLKIPCVIHQQDIVPSLANKLCQIPAKKITVTFEESLKDFNSGFGFFYKSYEQKTVLTGNPFRRKLLKFSKNEALENFGFEKNFPTLLVLGGGTGSEFLNTLIKNSKKQLTQFVQILHLAGYSKNLAETSEGRYKAFTFITNMGEAYAAADFVICRAGLSTLTELSNLGKVSIIVPMPNSHQEYNAVALMKENAALVISQKNLNESNFPIILRKILFNQNLQNDLSKNIKKIMPKNSDEKIANIIIKLAD
jgi:UDP-N-acetylglucosamine--N-acetylmuramyl-(pentapeptide) pyrophosphoryl-undecaprenol N-acetylglucosamine transferase